MLNVSVPGMTASYPPGILPLLCLLRKVRLNLQRQRQRQRDLLALAALTSLPDTPTAAAAWSRD